MGLELFRLIRVLEVRIARRSYGLELGYYVVGFGVSLGKDNWGFLRFERFFRVS